MRVFVALALGALLSIAGVACSAQDVTGAKSVTR